MYKMSSMRVLQLIKRIPSAVKCKCPQVIAVRLSRKSYATRGTRAPSKWESQKGGKREKTNLIESKKVVSI